MNNLLLIIGMIALSNGKISFLEKKSLKRSDEILFDINDIKKGGKMLDLSDEDLDRGIEIINRTKKYLSKDEVKFLVKIESILDLVKGIKKLSLEDDFYYDESDFFRSMDDEDKKNMMIKEILEVLPEKRKDSANKAIDIKRKIDLFAELFLPEDFSKDGFSLSSLMDFNNLSSFSNLSFLGELLRSDEEKSDDSDETYTKTFE